MKALQFEHVDALSLVASRGRKALAADSFDAQLLGPLMEIAHHNASGLLSLQQTQQILSEQALCFVDRVRNESEFWSGPGESEEFGMARTDVVGADYESRLALLFLRARTAGQKVSGLSESVSSQLVAAMRELESNISEHSNAHASGVIAFRAGPCSFEFVVADLGIGVLQSLRSSEMYPSIGDEGAALRAALSEGVSRYGPGSGRGLGFRPLFLGLMNNEGELRFRSGDHALTMVGVGPDVATARVAQKAPLQGFFASIRCLKTPNARAGITVT